MKPLTIDVRPGPYFSGSPVSGTVLLQGNGTFNVRQIQITFLGRCVTKIVENAPSHQTSTYWGIVNLFHFEQVLFQGPYTLRAPHQWPFEFRFPDRCSATVARQFRTPSSLFNEELQQPLPPSFTYISPRLFGPRACGFVSYELRVALVRSSMLKRNFHITKSLTLKCHRLQQNPCPQLEFASQCFTSQSIHLLPQYQDRPPSLRKKLSATTRLRKHPKVHYLLKAFLPKFAIIGQPLPLVLGVIYDPNHSTTTEPPTVFLRKVKVQLNTTTYVRCVSSHLLSRRDVFEISTSKHIIDIRDSSDGDLRMTNWMEMGSLMNLKISTQECSPNFSTFNIMRKHALIFHITIECGKRKHRREFIVNNLTLLPEDLETSGPQSIRHGTVTEAHAPQVKGPPPYRDLS
ncbi:MAG: hypothetical protein Q9220_005519 [cf. Caloplaca sp. 1 TL-2023]